MIIMYRLSEKEWQGFGSKYLEKIETFKELLAKMVSYVP
jgi:hypothetical protein